MMAEAGLPRPICSHRALAWRMPAATSTPFRHSSSRWRRHCPLIRQIRARGGGDLLPTHPLHEVSAPPPSPPFLLHPAAAGDTAGRDCQRRASRGPFPHGVVASHRIRRAAPPPCRQGPLAALLPCSCSWGG
jgi:hypothetical protein